MKTKNEEFEVLVPNIEGNAVAEKVKVQIPLQWDKEVQEWLLTPEAHQIIENTKARHMGLLLPAQLKELRERYDCTQNEMGELFQVGEKSWTRWESGKHRPSRSINLLIRALYEGEISINYLLKRAGKPQCKAKVVAVAQSPWSSLFATAEMSYVVVADRELVHFQSTEEGKTNFLKKVLHKMPQPLASPWPVSTSSRISRPLTPAGPARRCDYQSIKIA